MLCAGNETSSGDDFEQYDRQAVHARKNRAAVSDADHSQRHWPPDDPPSRIHRAPLSTSENSAVSSHGLLVQSVRRKNPQPRLKISHLPRASPAPIAEYLQCAQSGLAGCLSPIFTSSGAARRSVAAPGAVGANRG
jgi:hypothetical protein